MSLSSIKKRLAVDQRNVLLCEVVSSTSKTVTVRTQRGEVRSVPSLDNYSPGDRVQIQTDGAGFAVVGAANLASLDGEKIATV